METLAPPSFKWLEVQLGRTQCAILESIGGTGTDEKSCERRAD
jgi:hypothetical protein